MQVSLAFPDFKKLIGTACALMEASELGRDALKSDHGPAFMLKADGKTLELRAAVRGMELTVSVETNECTEEGEIAINPFVLKRLAAKTPEIKLVSTAKALEIKAGRLKTTIPAVQSVKITHYDEIELSNELPGKILADSLSITNLMGAQDSQPFTRLVWGDTGVRVWTHNPYNASHTMVLDDEGPALDTIVPVAMVMAIAMADGKQSLKIGTNGRAIRFKTAMIDLTHPIKMIEIENIETMVKDLDRDSIPGFEVDPAQLSEGLASVGSIDFKSGKSQQAGIDIRILPEKAKLVLKSKTSAGESSIRVDINGIHDLEEAVSVRLNYRQLTDFVNRAKGQMLRVGVMPDRTVLWSGPTTFVLAPVQEEQEAQ